MLPRICLVLTAEAVAEAQLSEQSKVIAGDAANVEGDRGTLTFAAQQLARFDSLAKTGAGTIESSQQAQSNLTERQEALERDIATLAAARGQVDAPAKPDRAGEGECRPGAGSTPPGGTQSVVHEDLW
jgi:multidrug resistance efflux pump